MTQIAMECSKINLCGLNFASVSYYVGDHYIAIKKRSMLIP